MFCTIMCAWWNPTCVSLPPCHCSTVTSAPAPTTTRWTSPDTSDERLVTGPSVMDFSARRTRSAWGAVAGPAAPARPRAVFFLSTPKTRTRPRELRSSPSWSTTLVPTHIARFLSGVSSLSLNGSRSDRYMTSSAVPCSSSSRECLDITLHPAPPSTSQTSYRLVGIGGARPRSVSTAKQSSRSISATHSWSISNPPRSASTCFRTRSASRASRAACRSSSVSPSSLRLSCLDSYSCDTRTA
mmetsp:Transcript_33336/g.79714  ORF Transcript_33336/g.79714 Transcript_33336/m.79714 type:complete len:242 (-) Transcript_33336:1359-2084(-)